MTCAMSDMTNHFHCAGECKPATLHPRAWLVAVLRGGLVWQVRMTGGAGMLDMHGLPGGHSSESQDKKKEEEEADIPFSADDIEK